MTPRANVLTFKPQKRSSLNSYKMLHFKRDSTYPPARASPALGGRVLATAALGQEQTPDMHLTVLPNSPHAPPSPDCGRRAGDEGKMGAAGSALASKQTQTPSPQPLSRVRERGYGKSRPHRAIVC
jgi:hypothetical protein